MIEFYKQYKKQWFDMRCEVRYDDDFVHILDTNELGTTSITNGIDLFISDIMKDIESSLFSNHTWICYCTDGVPFMYMNPGYKKVPEELLYFSFQQRSLEYVIQEA